MNPRKSLSARTLGLLVDVASGAYAGSTFTGGLTASTIQTMIDRAGLSDYGRNDVNKQERLRTPLFGAKSAAEDGDVQAHNALLAFVRLLVERTVADPASPPDWFGSLCESLLGDGYQLAWDRQVEQTTSSLWGAIGDEEVTVKYKILPTDAGPIPLAGEISALESELDARGYLEALNHYRRAVADFDQHAWEPTNSPLRTALEDIVVRLATENAGYVKPASAGGGGQAIEHLKRTANLHPREGGDLVSALWAMSHTMGSHPGTSNADETRFRLHVMTAVARFLLHRFPRRP